MKVVFVVGTTASGKSDLALRLAKEFSGAIVNCDSIQLYRSLNIGSAKPTPDEQKQVPHFLFDVVAEGDEITAGQYAKLCNETLQELSQKFPVVFVVGGTGFYFQALEKGMYNVGSADEQMKLQVEEELSTPGGAAKLYAELQALDPKAAEKIFPNDHYRLGRAIELMRVHKKSLSEVQAEFEKQQRPFPYPLLKIGLKLSREQMEPRVRLRTQAMLKAGLIKEVRDLLERVKPEWSPLSSVGYKETVEFLRSQGTASAMSMAELEAKITQNTLRLGKKQRTWFGRDQAVQWLGTDDFPQAKKLVEEFVGVD